MKSNETKAAGPKRRRWLFKLGWIGLALVSLLFLGYFVATSNAFFQRVILPRVGRSLDSTVTVTHASISPFSEVILRDLKVQPRGQEPVLVAKELRVRYPLMDLLRGQINLDEAVLEYPVVRVIKNADGTSNLDPILKTMSAEKPGETRPPPAPPSTPLRVDLKKLVLSHAAIHYRQTEPNGDTFLAEIPELNLELGGVKNGQTARFTLAANFKIQATSFTNLSQVSGTLKSDLSADLAGDLMPDRVEGKAELAISTATGAFADAAGLTTTLAATLSATEVKQLALRFAKGSASLGNMTVSGPLDLRKREGRLSIAVTGIGSEVLSLVGGRYDVSFGETILAARCDLDLKSQAKLISAIGSLTGTGCSLTRGPQTSPKLDFQLDYDLSADWLATNATLRQFTLNATQNGNSLLRAALTREMRIDWSQGKEAVPDSTLELTLIQMDLAQWQAVVGPEVKGGVINGKLGLTVQKAGKLIAFDLASQLAGLSAEYQSNRINGLNATIATRGQVADFSQVDLAGFNIQATHAGQPLISVKGSGRYNTATMDANLQAEVDASLVQTSVLLAWPEERLKSGTVKFTGRIAQTNTTPGQTTPPALYQEVVGDLQLANLVVRDASGKLPGTPCEAHLKLDTSLLEQRLDLRQVQLTLTPTDRAQNQLQLAGQLDLSRSNAITGVLKLVAESLDLTSHYDLFAGEQALVTATPTPPAASPPQPEVEPAAVELPLRQFVVKVEIGRLYLREMAITNLQATTTIDGGTVKLDPVQLALNGAPMRAKVDLNLGVPGYLYSVDLQARDVPLAPLVNTFQPERKGQMSGTATLLAQVTGAGLTGPSLQKNLAGQFDFGTTNLNLKLIDVRSSLLKSVIDVIISLPDIIRNPGEAISSIVKNLSSPGESSGVGWVDEVSKSPIDVLVFRGQAGSGRVDVQRALVQSLAFQVQTQGPVTLAPILTNSTIEFPVAMALRRSLAEKIGQVPAETPTNVSYVNLPDFLNIQGTVGDPKKKLNYPALGQMALKLGGGIAGGSAQAAAEQVSGALGGLKSVFGGKDLTHSVSTNTPSAKGILDGLLGQRAAPGTNPPPATNAAPKKGSPLDLLK